MKRRARTPEVLPPFCRENVITLPESETVNGTGLTMNKKGTTTWYEKLGGQKLMSDWRQNEVVNQHGAGTVARMMEIQLAQLQTKQITNPDASFWEWG